jgi:CheY-like chemotaxis protein
MTPKILVVDRNEAFATVLREMLEVEGGYAVELACTGSHALALLRQSDFDLTIVDMDLDPKDVGYRDLILSARRLKPTMRLMLIPLQGRDLPPDVDRRDIQAVLPKPFFADDLLPNIAGALAKQVSLPQQAPPARLPASPSAHALASPPARPPASPPARKAMPDLHALLSELAREISADAVLLLSRFPKEGRVLAHASTWDAARLEALADLSLATLQAAQAMARFLAQPDESFEHNMFEGDSLRLYMMAIADGDLLVAVTSVNTPLGTIRHNLRRTARNLAQISGT